MERIFRLTSIRQSSQPEVHTKDDICCYVVHHCDLNEESPFHRGWWLCRQCPAMTMDSLHPCPSVCNPPPLGLMHDGWGWLFWCPSVCGLSHQKFPGCLGLVQPCRKWPSCPQLKQKTGLESLFPLPPLPWYGPCCFVPLETSPASCNSSFSILCTS